MTPHFLLRSLVTLSTLAVMFAAAPAQARFGKSSEPEQGETAKRRGKPAKKSEVRTERGHAATAVRPRSSTAYVVDDDCCYDEVYVRPHSHGYVVVQPSPVYVSRGYTRTYQEEEQYVPEQRVEAFATAQPMLNGGMLGVNLRVDWARLGVDVRYDGLALWDDGTWSVDTIHMLDGTMTWSFFASDRGRLRAHLGLYSAFAPDAVFVGPGGGLSASINLFGPLTADAGGHLVLIPFTKLDSYAALGLRLGVLEARGGLRFTVLSDQGRVDGIQHTDVLAGPYISVGVVL